MPMRQLQREIDRVFGDFVPFFGSEEMESAVWAPKLDITESDTEYVVKMEVPGISKDQIKVDLEDHRLTVSGERNEEKKEEAENRLVVERSYGSFFRSISLPKAAVEAAVDAKLKDGVLAVTVKKEEVSKPRRIDIK
ncbi:MAG: Hsp20/alpha crystallin family protein [Rhodothermales bacterium]